MTAAFDTLAAVRRLEAAGMERKVAEAVAECDWEAALSGHEALATKANLAELHTATRTDLAALEARMTWRIVGLVIAANAALVAALKFLP